MRKSVDYELLSLIGEDARQNSQELAKQLNISSATVRRKLREFYNKDLLRITGVVDPLKFGFNVSVVVFIDVASDKLEAVIDDLIAQSRIWFISTTTGRFDMLVVARFTSTDELSDFLINVIGKISGIRNFETSICLDVRKGKYIPLVPLI